MKASTAERLEKIQSLFDSGKNHTEIAQELGYKKIESYYRYIYRYNDKLKYNKLYTKNNLSLVKPENESDELEKAGQELVLKTQSSRSSSKAEEIILLLASGVDVKETAAKHRFKDIQEMADYMKVNGYAWNIEKRNYVKKESDSNFSSLSSSDNHGKKEATIDNKSKSKENEGYGCLESYAEILKILESKKDKLIELLYGETKASLTRYRVQGVVKTKSINMSNCLETIINSFCEEMNITIKEAFEIATIDFLKKYGYEEKVNTILKT